MPKKKKRTYSQKLVNEVHADKLAGDTLREIGRNHKLSQNQVAYVLYTRQPTETAKQELVPDVLQRLGSAPPSKKEETLWEKIKGMLGLSRS